MLELVWLVDTWDIWVTHPVYLVHKELGEELLWSWVLELLEELLH